MKKVIKCLSVAVFAFLVAIGSFLIPKHYNKQSLLVAKADTITNTFDFDGSNLVTLACTYVDSSQIGYWSFAIFSFHLFDNENGVYCQVYGNILNRSSYDVFGTNQYFDGNFIASTTARDYNVPFSVGAGYNIPVYAVLSSSDFTCNIYKVRIYSRHNSSDGNFYWSFIEYYDVNDNVLTFGIRAVDSSGVVSNYMLDDRTYFFVSSSDFTESQQYNAGYQQGLADNQQNIYDNGYNSGNIVGYNNGYSAGVASANNYSFIGLIGAVVDVPVKTFMGLFDFNLLGINLATFFLGLITFAVIIFIIKIILGGK